jgi:hypothetical protein
MVDLLTLRARLDLPSSVIPDDELDEILMACQEMQAARTVPIVSGSSAALDRALIRRVGREVSAKGMPLGAGNTEFGQAFVPWNDPILIALEADHLLGGFA